VGAHVGVFVEVAQDCGWDAYGLEPSRWAVQEGERRGLNMIQGGLADAELPSDSFDAVTMWDVVEHLIDPMSDIREVARLLVLSLGQRHRQALALVVERGEITSRALANELDIGVRQASSLLGDLADYGLVSRHLARDRPGCRGFVWYPLAEIGGLH